MKVRVVRILGVLEGLVGAGRIDRMYESMGVIIEVVFWS